jgi:HEAT repeat protein
VPHLIDLSKDPQQEIRLAAVLGLQFSPHPAAEARLGELADDPDEVIRSRAALALTRREEEPS